MTTLIHQKNAARKFQSSLFQNSGQGLTEYLILLMLVCVASIAVVQGLGKELRGKISVVRKEIQHEVSKQAATGKGAGGLFGSGSQESDGE